MPAIMTFKYKIHSTSVYFILIYSYDIFFYFSARLTENVISESKELNFAHCGSSCLNHHFCVAWNYKENSKENETNCQLSNTAEHASDKSNTEDNTYSWTFYKAFGKEMVRKHTVLLTSYNLLFDFECWCRIIPRMLNYLWLYYSLIEFVPPKYHRKFMMHA
jgi:hypothetical protein